MLCGLTRLARFNVTVDQIPRDKGGKSLYFEGVPIPTSLALVAGMAVALWMGVLGGVGAVSGGGGGKAGLEMEMVVPGGVLLGGTLVEVHPIVAVFALWGCAMLSRRVRVPKL